MKLRINGNSIRLRLTPDEVENLSKGMKVGSSLDLINESLNYELIPGDIWNAEILGANISIFIPRSEVLGWAENSQVGFEHKFENGLLLLIEKDFQCLHPRKHEQEDHLYPNPNTH
ncbi:MAG: hypothetical protein HWE07_11230 [Cytophagia bacterium]|nr:hypothetical protein [Cytophagia bacterium]